MQTLKYNAFSTFMIKIVDELYFFSKMRLLKMYRMITVKYNTIVQYIIRASAKYGNVTRMHTSTTIQVVLKTQKSRYFLSASHYFKSFKGKCLTTFQRRFFQHHISICFDKRVIFRQYIHRKTNRNRYTY